MILWLNSPSVVSHLAGSTEVVPLWLKKASAMLIHKKTRRLWTYWSKSSEGSRCPSGAQDVQEEAERAVFSALRRESSAEMLLPSTNT